MRGFIALALVTTVLGLAACGGGSTCEGSDCGGDGGGGLGGNLDATPPAIAEGTEIGDLTGDDLGQLCDWYAEMIGGYEQQECPDVTVLPTSGSQELCISNAQNNNASCASTVGDWIACARTLAAVDLCEDGAYAEAQSSPECSTYYGSGGTCSSIK